MSAADPTPVAVQGEPGCNSALAAGEFFSGEVTILPCRTFADLFAAVKKGDAEYGMAPIENSLGGSIHSVWELLPEYGLPVRGEIYLHVRHCLIAHPGTRLEGLRRIYSHEQALVQCQKYIQKLGWIDPENVIPVYDTAGAVRMIKERGKREEAAIAPLQAAAFYEMEVLAEDIQISNRNHTRFLVLSHRSCCFLEEKCKTTLILSLPDRACGLPALLERLTRRQIQVSKVETRSRLGHPWEYRVYLECSGHAAEPPLIEAIEEMKQQAGQLHVVGSYPPAETA